VIPRRVAPLVAVLVSAAMLIGACGAAQRPQTLDHEADLVTFAKLQDLRTSTASGLTRLARACRALQFALQETLDANVAVGSDITDVQCHWTFDFPSGPKGGSPELVVGIVEGGDYRFHETAKILHGERTVTGVGDEALYDPQSRTLFCIRDGRLWYVEMVGLWEPKYDPQPLTTALARALMRERESA
jgi:hypothetical protein